MLNPTNIALLLLRAKAYRCLLVRQLAVKEYSGDLNTSWRRPIIIDHLIQGLSFCLLTADYTSLQAFRIYDNLIQFVGNNFAGGVSTDPTAQPPGSNIVIINNQQTIQSEKIPFVAQTVVTLASYQANYAAQFGNNPFLSIWVVNPVTGIGFDQDEQTAPTILYVGNDPTQGISSITWTYPVATSGYIQILGIT